MLWYAKTTRSIPKIMQSLIGQRSDTLSSKSHAKNPSRCWTGWSSRPKTGLAPSLSCLAASPVPTLSPLALKKRELPCAQYTSNKEEEEGRGKLYPYQACGWFRSPLSRLSDERSDVGSRVGVELASTLFS